METIERELIGALIKQPALLDTFYDFISEEGILNSNFSKRLIQALKYLRSKDIEIDGAILKSHIETKEGTTEEIKTFFLEIEQKTQTINFNYLLALLLLRKKRKDSVALGELLISIDSDSPEEFDMQLLNLFNRFESIVSENIKGFSLSHFEPLTNYLTSITAVKQNVSSTGFIDLDKIFVGFNWSEFIVIGSRPGMGKSTLAFNIALYNALENKTPTAIINLDYSEQICYAKLLSITTGISFQKFTKKKFSEEETYKINDGAKHLMSNNLIVATPMHATLKNIVYKIHYLKREYGIKLIVIDYLQLIDSESNKYNREQGISSICRKLKELSRSLQMTIIVTSQLSRAVEWRGGSKQPQLSDLRDSGSIEQDADSVWFVYRPEYYGIIEDNTGNNTAGIAEVIIAKNKYGSCETTKLHFEHSIPTFKNIEHSEVNENSEKQKNWDFSTTRKDEFS